MPAAAVLKPIMEVWALNSRTTDWQESRFIAQVKLYWSIREPLPGPAEENTHRKIWTVPLAQLSAHARSTHAETHWVSIAAQVVGPKQTFTKFSRSSTTLFVV